MSQNPLYFKNGEDLSHQTPHSFIFLLPLKRVNKLTFQNERLVVSQMAFWAQNVFGTFDKGAPDHQMDLSSVVNNLSTLLIIIQLFKLLLSIHGLTGLTLLYHRVQV